MISLYEPVVASTSLGKQMHKLAYPICQSITDDGVQQTLKILIVLEGNGKFINTNPKGEPKLGKRSLYNLKGGNIDLKEFQPAPVNRVFRIPILSALVRNYSKNN
jgi:aminopeptidase-like protein